MMRFVIDRVVRGPTVFGHFKCGKKVRLLYSVHVSPNGSLKSGDSVSFYRCPAWWNLAGRFLWVLMNGRFSPKLYKVLSVSQDGERLMLVG
jgi:hypothetical protein